MAPLDPTVRRVTASLKAQDVANLGYVMACTGLNGTDAIRKSLATEAWLQKQLSEGCTVLKMDSATGDMFEIEFKSAA